METIGMTRFIIFGALTTAFYNLEAVGYNLSLEITGDLMCCSYVLWIYITAFLYTPLYSKTSRPFSLVETVGTCICIGGIFLILREDWKIEPEECYGACFILVSAILYSIYSNMLEEIADEHESEQGSN